MSTGVASLLGSKQSLNTVDGAMSVGGVNSDYHLYVYSEGNPTAPAYARGIVNHHSGTLTAANSTLYAASTGWSAIGSGGFAHTGGIYGLSYYSQYDGVGGTNDYLIGGQFGAAGAGTTTTTEMRGVSGYIAVTGSGNQPLGYAFFATTTKGSTGVLSSYHAYYAEGLSSGFGATLGAAFSCPWNAAANQYGLYMSGTVQNHLGGTLNVVGAISIGNTVAAGVAVASTHKVTISIGGNTYYLLASNV